VKYQHPATNATSCRPVAYRNLNAKANLRVVSSKTKKATHTTTRHKNVTSIQQRVTSIQPLSRQVVAASINHNPKGANRLRLLSPKAHQATQCQLNDKK
jgi:hypothetical protein